MIKAIISLVSFIAIIGINQLYGKTWFEYSLSPEGIPKIQEQYDKWPKFLQDVLRD